MKLSSQQIQQLYKFTRQHFVEHFDVQTELVDHLANDIEEIWKKNPNISFENARDITFKKFGVFGFMEVVEARTAALNKKYWQLTLQTFKSFFKIPQLLITLTIFSLIYFSLVFIPNQVIVFYTLGFGVIILLVIRLFQLQQIKRKRFKLTGKKWLLEEYIYNFGNIGAFAYFLIQIPMFFDSNIASNTMLILVSFLFSCYLLLIYIIAFLLPKKAESLLKNQYPEYKLV